MSVFSCFEGFVDLRLAKDKNKQKIAFVDYDSEDYAKYAMNSTKGFRFAASTRGITVRFSERTRQPGQQQQQPPNGSKGPSRRFEEKPQHPGG